MANDTTIVTPATPGLADGTVYLLLFSGPLVFNGTAFVAKATADWATYGLAQPETPSGFGDYVLDFAALASAHSSAIVAGASYDWQSRRKAGGSRLPSDASLGGGKAYWDGTTLSPIAAPAQTALDSIVATLDGYNDLVTSGTVDDPSAATSSFAGFSSFSSRNSQYKGMSACFRNGELAGVKSIITSYVGSSRRFTFAAPFPVAPADGDAFDII